MYTRQNLAVSLVLAISMVGISYGAGGVLPGDGLSESTAYLIEDLTDFDVFADQANAATYWSSGVYTKLTCNPNLAGRTYSIAVIAPDTDNTDWHFNGISFEGVFDGNGHIIRNLTIDTAGVDNDYLGLFGSIEGSGAQAKNLCVENINITGGTDSDRLGGLCGYNDKGAITNCYATGAITGDDYLGGLCGRDLSGTITNCYAAGSVTGGTESDYIGGLCGYNRFSTITNCYAAGSVTGGDHSEYLGGLCGGNGGIITNCYANGSVTGGNHSEYLGGLCGNNHSTITNCYATGSVIGGSYLGGLCGYNRNSTTTNCFWDVETGGPDNDIGTPKTTAQMQMQSTFIDTGWDFTDETVNGTHQIWQMPTGGGYPVLSSFDGYTPVLLNGDGTEASPYLISDAAQLGAIYHYSSNVCFRLQSDIDLTGIQWSTAIVPAFGGCFDGNGYVIYNLNIEGGGYLGLFGSIKGSSAEVKNLGIENINITGRTYSCYLGGLCGENRYSTITNCYAAGSVTGGDDSDSFGGLCGINLGTITNCYVAGSVTGGDNSSRLAGLCGWNYYGTITNCYANGSVTGGTYSCWLGGLCGINNYSSTITNCYAAGSVTGGDDSDSFGGLCGINSGIIINCYAAGSVTGGDDSGNLGGLCGDNGYWDGSGTISNCYATGLVIGRDNSYNIGGLCGLNSDTITNCYAAGSVTGGTGSGNLGGLCGKNWWGGTISDCYSTGAVTGGTGSNYLGGLCGDNDDSTITNCFWDTQTSGMSVSDGGTGKITAQMQTESTFTDANWDFAVVPLWHMPFEAVGYPMLGWQKDIPGDFTGRYGVYMDDFAIFSNAWLSDDTPTADWNEHCDLDGNGVIDPDDLKIFAEHWLCD